ncbi:3-deoxy-D-manno-octulosonic acid transferase [Jannaschia sp. Os4]|uniref:3-deoxy-D-manno-octulosonic acid transferase n=1 Tax=Jannaschia sp. Os4 TaxID=2807617 RepID=UPI001EED89F5|nr:3-deoxy-D-manno-octulosonic acid transferase [Jannaschia sp. Os4]
MTKTSKPGFSPLLAAYLAFSKRGARWGARTLEKRLAGGKEDPHRLPERRGTPSLPRPEGRLVWLHAASVGESVSVLEMIRRMGEDDPDLHFLLTTGTVTSAAVLADRMPPRCVHQFVPLDVRPWMARFLDHWRPDLAVLAEGEIWPALIVEAEARGVPLALINARMTERAFRRWRWAPRAAASLLSRIAHVQAQEEDTARRLRLLGLPEARLEVTGTLKEGSAALPASDRELRRLHDALDGRPCWLAASTHDDEEAACAFAHRRALQSWHALLLVLAPRHPDRAPEIVRALRQTGWKVAQRSAGEAIQPETQVYVADTMGEMGLWYRLCPVSFVGGSLVPVGGHNPYEPAALGSAILHGPHVHNFAEIYERLTEARAAERVDDARALGPALARLLEPDRAAEMAHAAWEVCSAGAEVTDKAIDLLFAMLDGVD